MPYDAEVIATILRMQAWERAKGELEAMLNTYIGARVKFELMSGKVTAFIKDVEDNL